MARAVVHFSHWTSYVAKVRYLAFLGSYSVLLGQQSVYLTHICVLCRI